MRAWLSTSTDARRLRAGEHPRLGAHRRPARARPGAILRVHGGRPPEGTLALAAPQLPPATAAEAVADLWRGLYDGLSDVVAHAGAHDLIRAIETAGRPGDRDRLRPSPGRGAPRGRRSRTRARRHVRGPTAGKPRPQGYLLAARAAASRRRIASSSKTGRRRRGGPQRGMRSRRARRQGRLTVAGLGELIDWSFGPDRVECRRWESNPHAAFAAQDFKSRASASFATPASVSYARAVSRAEHLQHEARAAPVAAATSSSAPRARAGEPSKRVTAAARLLDEQACPPSCPTAAAALPRSRPRGRRPRSRGRAPRRRRAGSRAPRP